MKFGRSESPYEFKTELFVEVDAEGVEVEDRARTGVDTLTTFVVDFFFFGGHAAEDEAWPFLPRALFSFPSCLSSSL